MRQGQQNRRGRGRNNGNNNNNRGKSHQNPLTRSFESSGPDVKLRGTPSHIAEKYMSLARDAQSSGDPVLAENYLQHAEHYNRIIMAVREQQLAQGGGGDMNGGMNRPQRQIQPGDPIDGDDFDDDADEQGSNEQPQIVRGSEPQPQPQMRNQPYEQPRFGGGDRQDRHERPERHERHEHRSEQRHERHDRGERSDNRGERHSGDRHDRPERSQRFDRPHRDQRDREPREPRPFQERPAQQQASIEGAGGPEAMPRRRERFVPAPAEQPEFLRRPVRRPRREGSVEETDVPAPVASTTGDEGQS